jgi:cysteine-rich repeat protein
VTTRATLLLLAAALILALPGCGAGVFAEDPDAGSNPDGGAPDAGQTHDGGPLCGNGVKDPGEECDLGSQNGTGSGCESDCRFTCVSGDPVRGDALCDPHDACKGTGSCAAHVCRVSGALPEGSACGSGHVCRAGVCSAPVCGDGVREGDEQCDDGNTTNFDGCDSSCRFEQHQRANAVTMLFKTDAYCTANAMGASIGSAAQSQLQSSLVSSVADGSLTMAFAFLGLGDLTGAGATTSTFKLGAVSGSPYAAPAGKKYDGSKDLDWWYQTQAIDLDAVRRPTALLDATIKSKALSAGPGNSKIALVFGSGPVELAASSVRIKADVGASSAPTLASVPAATPGHGQAEHLDPLLTSFASLANGELCANLSAASLAAVPVPASLQTGNNACSQGYGATNTLLDVLVNGCNVLGGLVLAIKATQPDQVDPTAPAVGAGGPYKLLLSGVNVTGCKDKGGAAVALDACLKAAAFSSAFTFTADRVILK